MGVFRLVRDLVECRSGFKINEGLNPVLRVLLWLHLLSGSWLISRDGSSMLAVFLSDVVVWLPIPG